MSNALSSENLFAGVLKNKDAAAPAETAAAVTQTAPVEPVVPETPEPQVTELDMLKNRARLMGIQFSNNIGVDALRAKVQAKIDGQVENAEKNETNDDDENLLRDPLDHDGDGRKGGSLSKQQAASKPISFRQQMLDEQLKLVRLRITNLDPKKKDLPGEIFTFANRVIGAVRKFIPYGEATENGYHVPFCIYQQLKEREFLNIKTRKDSRGRTIVETGMAREFALEVLEPLTEKELNRLAASQAAAQGTD